MYDYDPFFEFNKRLHEEETPIAQESTMDKVIKRSPKVRGVLTTLLTSQKSVGTAADKELYDIVADVKIITYKPTTFRVIFKNSNYMDLKYDPTPDEVKNARDYQDSDFFRVKIAGRDYDLSNYSESQQVLDSIAIALKNNPIDSNNPDLQQKAGEEAPEGGEEAPAPEKDEVPDSEELKPGDIKKK